MPLIVIPDFTATAKPLLATVRAAEKAIVEVVGGVHETTRYPGDLDAANIAASTQFRLRQQAQPNHRVALGTGRSTDIETNWLPSEAGPKCMVLTDQKVDLDTMVFWHTDPTALTGVLPVYRNGSLMTEIQFPAAGVAQGECREFPFPYILAAGDLLEFRWLNGTAALVKVGGAAPSPYTRAFVTVWGIAAHVA